jgi:hypothetical protein
MPRDYDFLACRNLVQKFAEPRFRLDERDGQHSGSPKMVLFLVIYSRTPVALPARLSQHAVSPAVKVHYKRRTHKRI